MKLFQKITKVQWITLMSTLLYLFWEFIYLAEWKVETDGPLIRVDLVFIYPCLMILFCISIFQLVKNCKPEIY